jgi:glycosyltransferase involved in cell wall biosynthesis
MKKEMLSVILPVYNEAKTIRLLLDRVINVELPIQKEIIIIESNSKDGTREIIKGYENKKGIKIIYEDTPGGKGLAVRKGLAACNGSIIVIQDGDLEYMPEEYPILLKPILESRATVVFGSRHLGMKNWQIREYRKENIYAWSLNCGHILYTSLFNLIYGTNMTDPATMFKVFKKELIEKISFNTTGFDFDWELTAKLIKKGNNVVEVPVTYKSRGKNEGKKIKFFRDGFKVFVAIVKFRFFD